MQKKMYLILCALIVASVVSRAVSSAASCYPIQYGWVNNAQLSDLTNTNRTAYDFLLYRHLENAKPAMREEVIAHPDSLAAYVGFVQSDSSVWPTEVKRLRSKINVKTANANDLFKMGAVLFYQWGQQPSPPRDKELLAESQSLLGTAWSEKHEPIFGLMLGEALSVGTVALDKNLNGLSTRVINEQLLKDLCGLPAYKGYVKARDNHWQISYPPVSLVPQKNLKTLLAVVASLRSFYSHRIGTVDNVKGRTMTHYAPISSDYQAQQIYMENWFNALVDATK